MIAVFLKLTLNEYLISTFSGKVYLFGEGNQNFTCFFFFFLEGCFISILVILLTGFLNSGDPEYLSTVVRNVLFIAMMMIMEKP